MATAEQERGRFAPIAAAPVFAAAIFLSAFLLFAVQPLFTKMALPLLGGAPNVWNTAMVFFQTMLLLGYLYAHFISRRFSLRVQALIHGLVLTIGLFFLPLAIPGEAGAPSTGAQSFWLIGLMGAAIGAPFFALSANSPLLQRWFSYTAHRTADDPYYLYAASNVGSILSLLSYPLFFEPMFGLHTQSWLWSCGYGALIVFIAASSFIALGWRRPKSSVEASERPATVLVTAKQRLWWVALAIVPSGLMLSVTTHLTTNVAPSPFLWIAPLTLYLLSFVIVFSDWGGAIRAKVRAAAPLVILIGVAAGPVIFKDGLGASALHLLIFFFIALACHGELAARRPGADRLTEFYLLMSVGGVLGGVFTALIAPVAFPGVWEHPILMAAAAFLAAGAVAARNNIKDRTQWVYGGAVIIATVLSMMLSNAASVPGAVVFCVLLASFLIIAAIAYRVQKTPLLFALSIAGLFLLAPGLHGVMYGSLGEKILQERSFFGVSTIYSAKLDGIGPTHILVHGNTIHNMQVRTQADETAPLAYYSLPGPFNQALQGLRRERGALSVAAVGLGAGALACHVREGEDWTFFEIDPVVARIAQTPSQFSFLSRCAPDAPIVMGDGRISLAEERARHAPPYDIIIIDAFSSDSVPAHLITREALALYTDRLKPGGVVFFHTSNKFLDVSSVAMRIAADAGLDWRVIRFEAPKDSRFGGLITNAQAVVVGEADAIAKISEGQRDWVKETPHPMVSVWTDDYSNILATLIAYKTSNAVDARNEGQQRSGADRLQQ